MQKHIALRLAWFLLALGVAAGGAHIQAVSARTDEAPAPHLQTTSRPTLAPTETPVPPPTVSPTPIPPTSPPPTSAPAAPTVAPPTPTVPVTPLLPETGGS